MYEPPPPLFIRSSEGKILWRTNPIPGKYPNSKHNTYLLINVSVDIHFLLLLLHHHWHNNTFPHRHNVYYAHGGWKPDYHYLEFCRSNLVCVSVSLTIIINNPHLMVSHCRTTVRALRGTHNRIRSNKLIIISCSTWRKWRRCRIISIKFCCHCDANR